MYVSTWNKIADVVNADLTNSVNETWELFSSSNMDTYGLNDIAIM